MQNLAGSQLGAYRIVERIGEGGMATVYKAYQASVDRFVALKVLPAHYASDPNFMGRFKQEARVIAKLEHPNIIPVHDFGEQDGITYLVMRYLQAGSLKEILTGGPLPLTDVVRVTKQVSSALDYAHRQGVVHRDIKPANVLIDADGNAFLTDFGIAKMLEGNISFTATGGTVGTPAYMAPEQSVGGDIDARADIYSLGVTLYEMLTGRVPFAADTPVAVILKHLHDPLPMPRDFNPDIPAEVERVVLRAMAKDPEDRYASAVEMAADLEQAVATAETREARPSELVQRAEHTAEMRSPAAVTEAMRALLAQQSGAAPAAAPSEATTQTAEIVGRGIPAWMILAIVVVIAVTVVIVVMLTSGGDGENDLPDVTSDMMTMTALAQAPATATPDAGGTATMESILNAFASQTAVVEGERSTEVAEARAIVDTATAEVNAHATAAMEDTQTAVARDAEATADAQATGTAQAAMETAVARDATATVDAQATGTAQAAEVQAATEAAVAQADMMTNTAVMQAVASTMTADFSMAEAALATSAPAAAAAPAVEIQLGPIYYHPSGLFEIAPPIGWDDYTEASRPDLDRATWFDERTGGMVALAVAHLDEAIGEDALERYITDGLDVDLAFYDSIEVADVTAEADGIRLELNVVLDGVDYVARQWNGVSGADVWYVHLAAPVDDAALLDQLEQLVQPSFVFYPDASAGVTWPQPVEPGEPYTHVSQEFTFTPPAGWALEEDVNVGEAAFNVAQWSYWEYGAVLTISTTRFDLPPTPDALTAFFSDRLEPNLAEQFDDYAIVGRDYTGDVFKLNARVWQGDEIFLVRQLGALQGNMAWFAFIMVPSDSPAVLNKLTALVESGLVVHTEAPLKNASAFALPIVKDAGERPPLYREDFGVSPGHWRLVGEAAAADGRVTLPPQSGVTCECWGVGEYVLNAMLQLEGGAGGAVHFAFGDSTFVLDLAPDRPAASLQVSGETVAMFPVDPELTTRDVLPLWMVVSEDGLAVFSGTPEALSPLLAYEDLEGERGALTITTGDAGAALDEVTVWDLAPPEMFVFDGAVMGGLGEMLETKTAGRAPDVLDAFDTVTDAWMREGGTCDAPGVLGLCGESAGATYRYLAVSEFVLETEVSIDWTRATESSTFTVFFPAPEGLYWFYVNLWPNEYPRAGLERYDARTEEDVYFDEMHFSPAVFSTDPAHPSTLRIVTIDGQFAAYVDDQPILYVEGIAPGEGLVGFHVYDLSVKLDEFHVWRLAEVSGPPKAMDIWSCRDEAGQDTLCLEAEFRPQLMFAPLGFPLSAAVWSPDGRQLLVREETLEGPPTNKLWLFDLACYERPDCLVEPRPVGHEQTESVGDYDWSTTGEWIAMHDACALAVMHPDGTGYHRLWEPPNDHTCVALVAWAPPEAGSLLAAVIQSFPEDGTEQVQLVVYDMHDERPVTVYEDQLEPLVQLGDLAWFPGGDRIGIFVFVEEEESETVLVLPYTGEMVEGEPERVDFGSVPDAPWAWFPTHWPRWGQAPEAQPEPAACPGFLPSRLAGGGTGLVARDVRIVMRREARLRSIRTGVLEPGAAFNVIDGPVCAESTAWWLVRGGEAEGWIPEGEGDTYWLEPTADPLGEITGGEPGFVTLRGDATGWPEGQLDGGGEAGFHDGWYEVSGGRRPARVEVPWDAQPVEFVLRVQVDASRLDWDEPLGFSVNFGSPWDAGEAVRYMVAALGAGQPRLVLGELYNQENALPITAADLPPQMIEGRPFELTISVIDEVVRVYIDGALMLENPGTMLRPSFFGIWVGGGQSVSFKDLRIWPLTP